MADKVRFIMDRMAITFRQMEESQVFSNEEVRAIVKKRTDFEYSLRRMEMTVATFEEYLNYELSLDKLLEIRSKKLLSKLKEKTIMSLLRGLKTASIRHIHYIYERGLRRFPNNFELWDAAISFLERKQSNALLDELLGKAIALHPKEIHFWIKAAEHELQHNNNIHAARVLMQRSLRINETQFSLWAAYFRLEMWNIQRAVVRQRKLGISEEGMAEIIPGLMAPAMVVFRYAKDAILSKVSPATPSSSSSSSSTNIESESIAFNPQQVEDLSTLFSMHNDTLSPYIPNQLRQDIANELLSNTLPRLSHSVSLQQELLLHLLVFHMQVQLNDRANVWDSLPHIAREMVPHALQQCLSLLSTLDETQQSSSSAAIAAYVSRWLLRVVQKLLLTAAKADAKTNDNDNNNDDKEGNDHQDSSSEDAYSDEDSEEEADDEDEDEEDDPELNGDENQAKRAQRQAEKAQAKAERLQQKWTHVSKRLRMLLTTAYAQRHLLLSLCDMRSLVTHRCATVVRDTVQKMTASVKDKDAKKWKKTLLDDFHALWSRLHVTSETQESATQAQAIMHWVACLSLFGWVSEDRVVATQAMQAVSQQIGTTQVPGAPKLSQWREKMHLFSTTHIVTQLSSISSSSSSSHKQQSSVSFTAHSGPKLQLVQELQTWAAVTLSFLSLLEAGLVSSLTPQAATPSTSSSQAKKKNVTSVATVSSSSSAEEEETDRRQIYERLTSFLPVASPWLIQPVPEHLSHGVIDPTLLSGVAETPGSVLLLHLCHVSGNEQLYEQCIEQIVLDTVIVSPAQRSHWLLRAFQNHVPQEDDWILLTDMADIWQRWLRFVQGYASVCAMHQRRPHVFARVNLAEWFAHVFETVDKFCDVLHMDVSALFDTSTSSTMKRSLKQQKLSKPSKTHAVESVSEENQAAMARFVADVVAKAVSLCPQEDAFLDRQTQLWRWMGRHGDANHLQFKRRRLT